MIVCVAILWCIMILDFFRQWVLGDLQHGTVAAHESGPAGALRASAGRAGCQRSLARRRSEPPLPARRCWSPRRWGADPNPPRRRGEPCASSIIRDNSPTRNSGVTVMGSWVMNVPTSSAGSDSGDMISQSEQQQA